MSHSSLRLRGSSPVVGSSRNSTSGDATRLAARSSRRRMPPEKFFTSRSPRRRGRAARAARRPAARRAPWAGGAAGRPSRGSCGRSCSPSTVACCAATPMRRRTAAGSATTSRPATVAAALGRHESVVRMRIAVVLPAPLWPSRPRTVPGRDVEVEVAQGPEVAVALAEAVGARPRSAAPARGRCSYARTALFVHSTTNLAVHCTDGKRRSRAGGPAVTANAAEARVADLRIRAAKPSSTRSRRRSATS